MIQHTHTDADEPSASVFILGADTPAPVYTACFGHALGEPSEVTEERWDKLAQEMWAMGIEPPEDEPFYTVVRKGVVWDHYSLRPVYIPNVRTYERPLHV